MKSTDKLEPSLTGLLESKLALFPTLFTVTAAVYSVKPSSLSMIRPFTVKRPLSAKAQLVEGLVQIGRASGRVSEVFEEVYAYVMLSVVSFTRDDGMVEDRDANVLQ